ncbi:MAG: SH3 domain-containing protein [Spirochaetaceae bacterium]|nr:MAG: SH3 domain-containing protein [Spirochaetaceae bacterium]
MVPAEGIVMQKRLFLLLLIMVGAIASVPAQTMMSVEVRETQVRSNPSFLGRIDAVLNYGDRVEVLEQAQGWSRVSHQGSAGWVHSSALTTKRIVMQAGEADAQRAASGSEVALAGRGFNQEVEDRYRAEQGLNYDAVDRMEGFAVEPERLAAFLNEGELRLPGGEQ